MLDIDLNATVFCTPIRCNQHHKAFGYYMKSFLSGRRLGWKPNRFLNTPYSLKGRLKAVKTVSDGLFFINLYFAITLSFKVFNNLFITLICILIPLWVRWMSTNF